ncbi:hypothetical protein TRVA0_024S00958 [Trichomonascus vanleenenianus]|uniref:uncharacterized protein n=1 Tax=Trichomonascus vanleenenianus TaxID=2268995 RepID=UPI003ECA6D74
MSYRYVLNDSLIESIDDDLDSLASVIDRDAPDKIADSLRSDDYDMITTDISGLPTVTLEEIESQVFPKNTPVLVEDAIIEPVNTPTGSGIKLRHGAAQLYARLSPHLNTWLHDAQRGCQVGLIMRVRDSENPAFHFEVFHISAYPIHRTQY